MKRPGWDYTPEARRARALAWAERKLALCRVRPLATPEDVAHAGFLVSGTCRFRLMRAEMEAVSDVDALAARGRRRVALSGVTAPANPEPDDRVMAALDRLRPRQRLVVLLRFGAGLSLGEIARHIDRSRELVRGIERKALARLYVLLGPSVRRDGLV